MDLPAELRIRIYEHAHKQDGVYIGPRNLGTTIRFHLTGKLAIRLGREASTQPPLTQVSRQLRHETLPIYYQQNCFYASTETVDYGGSSIRILENFAQWLANLSDDAKKDLGALKILRRARYQPLRGAELKKDARFSSLRKLRGRVEYLR